MLTALLSLGDRQTRRCRACFPAWLSRHSRGSSGGAGLFSHSYHAFKNSRVYFNAPGIFGCLKWLVSHNVVKVVPADAHYCHQLLLCVIPDKARKCVRVEKGLPGLESTDLVSCAVLCKGNSPVLVPHRNGAAGMFSAL